MPALQSGADAYLSFPFDAYDLVAAVDALKQGDGNRL
jgi:DNA-binding response OmpR family regulator